MKNKKKTLLNSVRNMAIATALTVGLAGNILATSPLEDLEYPKPNRVPFGTEVIYNGQGYFVTDSIKGGYILQENGTVGVFGSQVKVSDAELKELLSKGKSQPQTKAKTKAKPQPEPEAKETNKIPLGTTTIINGRKYYVSDAFEGGYLLNKEWDKTGETTIELDEDILNIFLNRSEEFIELSIKKWAQRDDEDPKLKELQALAKARKKLLAETRSIDTDENDNLSIEEDIKSSPIITSKTLSFPVLQTETVKVIEEEPAPHIVQDSDKTKTEDAQFKTTNTPETNTPETNTPETSTPETSTPETNIPETNTPETNTPENQPTKGRYAMPIIVNGDTEYDYYSNYVQNYAMVSDGKDGNVKVSAIQDRNYDYRDNRLKNPITIVPHETPLIADGDDHYDIYLGNLDSNNHFIYCSKSKSILGVDQENIHKAIRATYLESALAQENGTTINQTTTTTYIDNQGVSSVLVIPVLPLPSYFHGHLHSHHGHGPMPIPPPPPMRGKGHNYGGNRPPAPRPKGTSYGDNRPPASRPQGTSYESNRPPASRPQGTSYEGNRPPASKPQGTSYGGNRPPALKPQGTSYGGNRQSIQIPTPMKSTPNSGGNRPSKPKNQTPNYGSSRPSVQIPTPKPTPNYGGSRPSTPKPGPSIGGYSQSTPKPKPQTPKLQQPKQQNFKPKNTNSGNNNGQRKPKPNQYQNKGKSR